MGAVRDGGQVGPRLGRWEGVEVCELGYGGKEGPPGHNRCCGAPATTSLYTVLFSHCGYRCPAFAAPMCMRKGLRPSVVYPST